MSNGTEREEAMTAPAARELASCTTDNERGTRLVGPHGGLKQPMPNPTDADLADPQFEAIWQVIKSWDVNVPEFYQGYCGANGSHVMLILAALRAASETKGCTYPACDCAMAWTGKGPVPETVCPRGESAATPHPEAVVKESLTPHSDHPMRVWDRTCPACNALRSLGGADARDAEIDAAKWRLHKATFIGITGVDAASAIRHTDVWYYAALARNPEGKA